MTASALENTSERAKGSRKHEEYEKLAWLVTVNVRANRLLTCLAVCDCLMFIMMIADSVITFETFYVIPAVRYECIHTISHPITNLRIFYFEYREYVAFFTNWFAAASVWWVISLRSAWSYPLISGGVSQCFTAPLAKMSVCWQRHFSLLNSKGKIGKRHCSIKYEGRTGRLQLTRLLFTEASRKHSISDPSSPLLLHAHNLTKKAAPIYLRFSWQGCASTKENAR